MKTKNIAVYPGTFDPFTNGHLDIVNRALKIFDEIIIAIPATSFSKKTLFSPQERKIIIEEIFQNEPRVKVEVFEGLLVNFLKKLNVNVIIRGLRAVSDFDYEFQMALMNYKMGKVETVFLMASEENLYLSSSVIKEIFFLGGDISDKVPTVVLRWMEKKKMEVR